MSEETGLGQGEQVLAELLEQAHLTRLDLLADLVVRHAWRLGVRHAVIYLADLEETVLVPLPAGGGDGQAGQVIGIEGTAAGLAYRRLAVLTSQDTGLLTGGGSLACGHRVWLPLQDGIVRLGVLELTVGELDDLVVQRCRLLARVITLVIVGKEMASDTFARLRRRKPMQLSAELIWAFMPGRSFATEEVAVAADLEPAYQVGGDAYDYSLIDHTLHASVFDATGHDLRAGLVAAVGLASCRNTRRRGGGLAGIAVTADAAIAGLDSDGRFLTGLLADLNLASGQLTWVNCGHPPPLLIRGGKVVKELDRLSTPPMGYLGGTAPPVNQESLQPGDRLLCYTDGVIDARTAGGDRLGTGRLADAAGTLAAGIPVPEALRRLAAGLRAGQPGPPADDATMVLAEWRPDIPWVAPAADYQAKARPRAALRGRQRSVGYGARSRPQAGRSMRCSPPVSGPWKCRTGGCADPQPGPDGRHRAPDETPDWGAGNAPVVRAK